MGKIMTNKIEENPEQLPDELSAKAHLAAYDLLKSTAAWLESPNNEVFGLLEFDENSLAIAARASIIAAEVIKKAAIDIQLVSGVKDTNKYSKDMIDAMSDLAALANEFDISGDDNLVKKAGVLDEILVTMASGVEAQKEFQNKFDKKIAEIKEKSKRIKEDEKAKSGVKLTATESKGDQKKNDRRECRPLEESLSTRYCRKCTGLLARLREDLWYCVDCSQQVNFKEGYTTAKGNKVPGSSVENQTADLANPTIDVMFGDKK